MLEGSKVRVQISEGGGCTETKETLGVELEVSETVLRGNEGFLPRSLI